MTALRLSLVPLALALSSAPPSSAQKPALDPPEAAPELGCDESAIRWAFPDEFAAARERARAERRLLIIKGISFGVDDAGAKCATAGQW